MSEVAAAVTPAAPAAPPPAAPAAPAEGVPQDAQNTAEQAPATAPEGDKPDTGQDPEKRKGQARFERRLSRAFKEAAEAKARAEFYEKQLNETRATQQAPADPAAPKLEQFSDIEQYAAAKAKYESEKTLKEHQSKQAKAAQEQAQKRLVEDWETRAERGAEKYEDWAEVVGEIQPNAPWAMAVMQVDNGDDVAHHLGKNLKEAQRIAALPPLAQAIEIGKLAAKIAAEPKKPKTPSQAPAPITPLKGNAAVVSEVPTENDNMAAWMAKRNKQIAARRK